MSGSTPRATLTEKEAEKAIRELQRRKAVDVLLYLNSVRTKHDLAHDMGYQRVFSSYYRLSQSRPSDQFKAAFFDALYNAAKEPQQVTFPKVLQEMFHACGKRHPSFCSKLIATVRDDAVVFDKNVATYFGVATHALPSANWIEVAVRRYEAVEKNIGHFLTEAAWPSLCGLFEINFPQAAHLPPIRKADLLIWSHVGLQKREKPTST